MVYNFMVKLCLYMRLVCGFLYYAFIYVIFNQWFYVSFLLLLNLNFLCSLEIICDFKLRENLIVQAIWAKNFSWKQFLNVICVFPWLSICCFSTLSQVSLSLNTVLAMPPHNILICGNLIFETFKQSINTFLIFFFNQ